MKYHSAIKLLGASFLMVAMALLATAAVGQDNPNLITTVVNSTACFTRNTQRGPLVFCRGGFAGDGGPAAKAQLSTPMAVAVDKSGNLFISDNGNFRVRRVDAATGIITTVAGGSPCRSGACAGGFSGDGGLATKAKLHNSFGGITLDSDGNLFVCDSGNSRVRRVDHATGIIRTVAGSGERGFAGDGGPATSAKLDGPLGVAVDASGNIFIADGHNRRVRRVDSATGIITTVAGGGNSCRFRGQATRPAPECQALDAGLTDVAAVLVNESGDLYIAAWMSSEVRRVDHATGLISWVAGGVCPAPPLGGSCGPGFEGDAGPALDARLRVPYSLAMDGSGNLFIADTGNGRVRRVDQATGMITTVVGSGGKDYGRDGVPAMKASLNSPYGIAVDAKGNLFIADTIAKSIRKVSLTSK